MCPINPPCHVPASDSQPTMYEDYDMDEFELDRFDLLCDEIMNANYAPKVRVSTPEDFDFLLSLLEEFLVSYIESNKHGATDRELFLQVGRVCVTRPLREFFSAFKEELAMFLTNMYCAEGGDPFHCYFWSLRISEDLSLNWLRAPLASYLEQQYEKTKGIPAVEDVGVFLVQKCRDWMEMETYDGFLYDILAHNFVITSFQNSGEAFETRRYYTPRQFEEAALAFCELSLRRNFGAMASVVPQELYSHIFLKCFNMRNRFEEIAVE